MCHILGAREETRAHLHAKAGNEQHACYQHEVRNANPDSHGSQISNITVISRVEHL